MLIVLARTGNRRLVLGQLVQHLPRDASHLLGVAVEEADLLKKLTMHAGREAHLVPRPLTLHRTNVGRLQRLVQEAMRPSAAEFAQHTKDALCRLGPAHLARLTLHTAQSKAVDQVADKVEQRLPLSKLALALAVDQIVHECLDVAARSILLEPTDHLPNASALAQKALSEEPERALELVDLAALLAAYVDQPWPRHVAEVDACTTVEATALGLGKASHVHLERLELGDCSAAITHEVREPSAIGGEARALARLGTGRAKSALNLDKLVAIATGRRSTQHVLHMRLGHPRR